MSRTSTANTCLFWVIVAVLGLAPIPIASNRPFWWDLNAAIVSCIALIYWMALRGDFARLRIPLRAIGMPGLLLLAALAWLAIQIVPLPRGWLPRFPWVEASLALGRDLGASISVDRAATIGMIVRLATYGILFFLALQVTANPARARRMLQAVFWIIVIHAGLAIIMLLQLGDKLLFFFPKWAYPGAATGFFVNRNSFATFVAFGIAIGTLLAIHAYSSDRKRSPNEPLFALIVYVPALAVLATASVLSASRMGVVVAAIGASLASVIPWFRARSGGLAMGLVGAGCLVIAALAPSGAGLAGRIGSIDVSADDRLLLYQQVMQMIAERPWIGYGGGTFPDAFPLFHRLPLSADLTWDAAHNLYLELFADLGFGAVSLLLPTVLLFGRIIRGLFLAKGEWLAPAAGGVVMVVAAVHSLVDFSLQIQANAFLFIVVVASGVSQAWIGTKLTGKIEPVW